MNIEDIAMGPSEQFVTPKSQTWRMCLRHDVVWNPKARATCFIGKTRRCPSVYLETPREGARYLAHELIAIERYRGNERVNAGREYLRKRLDEYVRIN